MSQINTGGPAFPLPGYNQPEGMSLRDYFAAKAMQAWFPAWERDRDFDLADRAYKLADAMIATRKKGGAA
jgi:hypothetical protein